MNEYKIEDYFSLSVWKKKKIFYQLSNLRKIPSERQNIEIKLQINMISCITHVFDLKALKERKIEKKKCLSDKHINTQKDGQRRNEQKFFNSRRHI